MKTVLIGLDAFDPIIFERLSSEGKLPHLSRLAKQNAYRRFEVASPPQSEVSWTSIATGLNAGHHGIFDFVHRDPQQMKPFLSLLPTQKGRLRTKFVRPTSAKTIFEIATSEGYPATALWWPMQFPANFKSPVRTIPGLGTPDIFGRWGVGTFFSTDAKAPATIEKTTYDELQQVALNRYVCALKGPVSARGQQPVSIPIELVLHRFKKATISIEGRQLKLEAGQWSETIGLKFKFGRFSTLHCITRVLVRVEPSPSIYFLPLQINPERTPWPYATPPRWAKKLWKKHDKFLTIGWPQDTTALEEACITDQQFLSLCEAIFLERSKLFWHQLNHFKDGILAIVFDTLDRIQHMFLRQRPDIVEAWYKKIDDFIGRILPILQKREIEQFVIVSDHGFASFDYKVNVNKWLQDNRFQFAPPESSQFSDITWRKTCAYALGLNSIYLNLQGREKDGFVHADKYHLHRERIAAELALWRQNGRKVVQRVLTNEEAFNGPLAQHGPDLVVGFAPGFRASAETALGGWGSTSLAPNNSRWRADHCIAAESVPGVVFAKHSLSNFPSPSYLDIPALAIDRAADSQAGAYIGQSSDEDDDLLKKRLESLGYLN